MLDPYSMFSKRYLGFFEILLFCPFFGPPKLENLPFRPFSEFWGSEKGPKKQNFKKSQVTFGKHIIWIKHAKNWDQGPSRLEKNGTER